MSWELTIKWWWTAAISLFVGAIPFSYPLGTAPRDGLFYDADNWRVPRDAGGLRQASDWPLIAYSA